MKDVLGVQSGGAGLKPSSYVTDLIGPDPSTVARLSVALIGLCLVFFLVLISAAGKRWTQRPETDNNDAENCP